MTGAWFKKRIGISIAFLVLLSWVIGPAAVVQAAESSNLEVNASSAIIIEASTGQVLYGMNENEARPPASMAKMMTEYLVMEAIHSGRISWDDMVTASKYAARIPGSGQLIAEGDKLSVRNLFRNMSIYSGNDATVVLAEFIAGSEENFVRMMNEKAREMGLSEEAHFVNATGLDREYVEEQLIRSGAEDQLIHVPDIPGVTLLTAKDAATIARYVINDYPEVLEIASQTRAPFLEEDPDSIEMINWNYMLEGWETDSPTLKQFAYKGLDGLKTGFTTPAGYCFTGTAERNGMRLITVVMNTESETQRFIETAKLMDYGFNTFQKRTILTAKSSLDEVQTVPVKKGVETEVPIVIDEGVEFIVNKNDSDDKITLDIQLIDEEALVAPLAQGEVVGTVTVHYDSPTGVISKQVNLITTEDVEKAGWFRLLFRSIKLFFSDLFNGIKDIF